MAAPNINFLIVHGTMGGPQSNWFPWLKQKLEQDGHRVTAPVFPTPEGQSFDSWRTVAENALKDFNAAETVLIGHSTGAGFSLRLAEMAAKPYKAIFAVCPFVRDLGLDPYDRLNSTFMHHDFDWNRVKRNGGKILCLAGDDDPYVPLPYAQDVAKNAGADLTVIRKGGHLNAESGYLEFPLLLDKIHQIAGGKGH